MILTAEQAYAVLLNLQEPERTADNSYRRNGPSHIRMPGAAIAGCQFHWRNDPCGSDVDERAGKSKASKGPVPLHPLLADFMRLWKQKTKFW